MRASLVGVCVWDRLTVTVYLCCTLGGRGPLGPLGLLEGVEGWRAGLAGWQVEG